MRAKASREKSGNKWDRGQWLPLIFLFFGLLITRRQSFGRSSGGTTDTEHWTEKRDFWLTLAIVGLATLFLNPFQLLRLQVQQQASVYVAVATWAAFIAVAAAATWTVLPYGSSKNRTDTAAAFVIFGVLIMVSVFATVIYVNDRNLVSFCSGAPELVPPPDPNFSCDPSALANARTNAEELQRINTLSTLGQIVPLLSILKDVFQSWFSPPGTDETASDKAAERKRARRARRLATERTALSWAPVWVAWGIVVLLWILFLLSRFIR